MITEEVYRKALHIVKLYESEQLLIHSIVRGGAIEAQSIPGDILFIKDMEVKVTPNTPTEPLPAEGSAKSVSVGCKNYDFHGSDILRYGRCAYCGNTE